GGGASVVGDGVDGDLVGRGVGLHLGVNRLSAIDADVGGEALDGGIASAVDVPLARRRSGVLVLAGDGVGSALSRGAGTGRLCEAGEHETRRGADTSTERAHPSRYGHGAAFSNGRAMTRTSTGSVNRQFVTRPLRQRRAGREKSLPAGRLTTATRRHFPDQRV